MMELDDQNLLVGHLASSVSPCKKRKRQRRKKRRRCYVKRMGSPHNTNSYLIAEHAHDYSDEENQDHSPRDVYRNCNTDPINYEETWDPRTLPNSFTPEFEKISCDYEKRLPKTLAYPWSPVAFSPKNYEERSPTRALPYPDSTPYEPPSPEYSTAAWKLRRDNEEKEKEVSKYDLVQELIEAEQTVEQLEKELERNQARDRQMIREPSPGADDLHDVPGEYPVDAETATKIDIFRSEIKKLEDENRELRRSLRPGMLVYELEPIEFEAVKRVPEVKPVPDSSIDSGLASLEGNTSESSEDYRDLGDRRL